MSGTQKCSDCLYYAIKSGLCRRYPDYVRRGVDSWCGEFKADFATDGIKQRIDALERRIVKLESRTAASEGRLDGMTDGVLLRFEAIEQCVELLERKLNHKRGNK